MATLATDAHYRIIMLLATAVPASDHNGARERLKWSINSLRIGPQTHCPTYRSELESLKFSRETDAEGRVLIMIRPIEPVSTVVATTNSMRFDYPRPITHAPHPGCR